MEMCTQVLLSVAEKYGTPTYVYDAAEIEERTNELKGIFDGATYDLLYAMKANSNIAILRKMNLMGIGFDACSIEEVFLALQSGCEPQKIFFNADCMSQDEMRYAAMSDVNVIIGALDTLSVYGMNFPGADVGVRINTGFGAGHSNAVVTGGDDSKFGISIEGLDDVRRICEKYNLNLKGVHSHAGSGMIDYADYAKNAK